MTTELKRKPCTKCLDIFPLEDFYKRADTVDGRSYECKCCGRKRRKRYCQSNREAVAKSNAIWASGNPEKVKEAKAKWLRDNKELRKKVSSQYNARLGADVARYKKHREHWRKSGGPAKQLEYERKRRATDLNYRLRTNLRSRLVAAARSDARTGSAVKDLGCTIPEFRQYIELMFQPGMSWENWGRSTWHLDHVIPLAAFDLSDPVQAKQALKYTNYQPLWAKDNWKKSAKVGSPRQLKRGA